MNRARREKINRLVDFVRTYRDSTDAQRIMSVVLNDKNLQPTENDYREFEAQIGRTPNEQLEELMQLISPGELKIPRDVTARDETRFPNNT